MASATTTRRATTKTAAKKKPAAKVATKRKTPAKPTAPTSKKDTSKKGSGNAKNDTSRLSRALVPMATDVRTALRTEKLRKAYDARPAFQRNDYLAWIERAKRPETRQKRLDQMLDELVRGDVYMKMSWSPKA